MSVLARTSCLHTTAVPCCGATILCCSQRQARQRETRRHERGSIQAQKYQCITHQALKSNGCIQDDRRRTAYKTKWLAQIITQRAVALLGAHWQVQKGAQCQAHEEGAPRHPYPQRGLPRCDRGHGDGRACTSPCGRGLGRVRARPQSCHCHCQRRRSSPQRRGACGKCSTLRVTGRGRGGGRHQNCNHIHILSS